PMGIEDGRIPNRAITASSESDRDHGAARARLNTRKEGKKRGAWSAKKLDRRQWLQVDLGKQALITKVLTQGRQDHNQWVKTYKLLLLSSNPLFEIFSCGFTNHVLCSQVFLGNSDRNTVAIRSLGRGVRARYVRIHPLTWHGHISMRIELLGRRPGKRVFIVT
ncbi:predicted protein, partial [Nematostella vectensis]